MSTNHNPLLLLFPFISSGYVIWTAPYHVLFTESSTLPLAFYQCLTKILLILLPPPPSLENQSLFTFLLVGTLSSKTFVQPRDTHCVSVSIVWDTILSGCLAVFDPEVSYYCLPRKWNFLPGLWDLHISCLPLKPLTEKTRWWALWQKGFTTSVCLSTQTWPGFTLVAKRSLSFENANLYTVRKLMVNGWIIRY